MSASFNRVFLMGNLTRDPQVKQLPSSTSVTEFGLAVSRRFKTASGEDREEVAFVDCTAFGKQAETIAQYCTKGKPIFVEGRLKYDTWDDKGGQGKRSKLTVVVENFQFLPSPRDGNGNADTPFRGRPEGAGQGAAGGSPTNTGQSEMFGTAERKGWRGGNREGRPARTAAGGSTAPPAEKPFGADKQFEEADIPF